MYVNLDYRLSLLTQPVATPFEQDPFHPCKHSLDATMAEFANAIKTADQLFPNDKTVYNSIRTAWKTVGVIL
ncbi:hypothetical protein PNK_0463 [Candidatus Protochlamydia naegleriophila]|uniref:Uncharacterized protein n=1 Tax=Candidatus Protochlamydia naegleriophila TaxID=389348 RepID=A0A0U5CN83_9BACT|nr:hypothetical protein [Candidatus Protochlamydia naegleriophila]CUI16092.1 hypothetical protein PNK_0463 [Candidatus Protochlamydia naegleriophila]